MTQELEDTNLVVAKLADENSQGDGSSDSDMPENISDDGGEELIVDRNGIPHADFVEHTKKRERRSKEDGSQRNYVCGCGTSYLSYAALYTHAKTKHEGQFPEGTTTLHKKKQGRPKVKHIIFSHDHVMGPRPKN
jgi:hypothetical protein